MVGIGFVDDGKNCSDNSGLNLPQKTEPCCFGDFRIVHFAQLARWVITDNKLKAYYWDP